VTDDTAWVVENGPIWQTVDRPCDTCGGAKRYAAVTNGQMVGWQDCRDCDGTGRLEPVAPLHHDNEQGDTLG